MKTQYKVATAALMITLFAAGPFAGFAADKSTDKADKKLKAYTLKTCAVTDEDLDSMGKPYVHEYKGREIKLCCKSCLKDFNKKPDKYVKKIEEAEAKARK